jgi:branched-chain amino acid transport system permease protein
MTRYSGLAASLFLVAGIGLLPLVLDDFETLQFAYVGIYFLAIAGLDLLTGYTGQISLGHGGFMAVGGYATAILCAKHGVPYYWTLPVAGAVTGLAGWLGGIPALRLSGLYLALATFGVAVAVPALIKHFEHFTGGSTGLGFPIVKAPAGTGLTQNEWFYYLAWACGLLGLLVAWLLVRGRTGRAFRALRDSEVAAASSGVHLAAYKTFAFGVSAAFAGVAGALYAITNLSYVSPDTYRINLSIFLVVGAVVAGLGSLWGLLAGALLIEFLPVKTPDIVNAINWVLHTSIDPKAAGVSDLIFGGVLVLVMLLLPGGVAGAVRGLVRPLYTRREPEVSIE